MARWTNRFVLRLLLSLAAAALLLGLLARGGALSSRRPSSASASARADWPLEAESLLEMELDRILADVRARFAAKQQAVQDLLAGRATLADTLALFRKLNTSHLVDGEKLSEESICGDVLIHADYLYRDHAEGASGALASLREQVRKHLAGRESANR